MEETNQNPIVPQPLTPKPRKWLWPVILFFVLGMIAVSVWLVIVREQAPINPTNQDQTGRATTTDETVASDSSKDLNQKVYFGQEISGKYSLVDVESGQTQAFIPAGYALIRYDKPTFPAFLILQKGDELFAYDLSNDLINSVFGSVAALRLQKNEKARVYPSITEKSDFLIIVDEIDPNAEGEMGPPIPLHTRSYTFEASTNKLKTTKNIDLLPCFEYDSKNQRLFKWPCGEGIGNSIPLTITDLDGNVQKEIISLSEFGLSPDDIGAVDVAVNNGLFFATYKNTNSKIVILDPQTVDPKKEMYEMTPTVKSQITDTFPYSVAVDRQTSSIIVGGSNNILLLRYDSSGKIYQSTYIPDMEVYANFIFSDKGRLYYQAKQYIRVVNLETWKVEKSILTEKALEITLFSFTKRQ